MRLAIWGVGERGKRIYSRLHYREDIVFIDSDENKIGTEYDGKRIIGIEEYVRAYSQYFILITPSNSDEIQSIIAEYGISYYFELGKTPIALQSKLHYDILDKYLQKCDCSKRSGVYGLNFYSIFLYDRFFYMGCRELYLIPERGVSNEKLKKIEESFDWINILMDMDWGKYIDIIYTTTYRGCFEAECMKGMSAFDVQDVYEFSSISKKYWNETLERFKSIHSGQRCFIVATGPSLQMEDLETLRKNREKCIGMNKLFLAFKRSEWRPDYYVVEDKRCIKECYRELSKLPVNSIFLSDLYPAMWQENLPANVYRYHSENALLFDDDISFSNDIVKKIYAHATVTYSCIQLAVYMGFREIILIGVDFSFSGNYKDKGNHFDPDYYDEKSEVDKFWEKESIQAYCTARKYAEYHGIKIYNATRGGKLEVFERIDFDSLFC